MRFFTYILFVGFALCSFQCKDETLLPCMELRTSLVEFDNSTAIHILDQKLEDLLPHPTSTDQLGHEANMNIFISRLKDDCGLEAEMFCYACIETLPLQTEIIVQVETKDTLVSRTIDILTRNDGNLVVANIHE